MERKKQIWIIIAVGLGVGLIVLAGILYLDMTGKNPFAPVSLFAKASPRPSADDYAAPDPSPSPGGDQLVGYGIDFQAPTGSPRPSPGASPLGQGDKIVVQIAPRQSPQPLPPSPAAVSGDKGSDGATAQSTPAATKKPASGGTATAKPAATKKPASPKPVKVTSYWIQVASFSSRGKADDQKALLADKGLSSIITTALVGGKTYYRVRLGPYSTNSEASGWLGKIKTIPGCSQAFISQTTRTQ